MSFERNSSSRCCSGVKSEQGRRSDSHIDIISHAVAAEGEERGPANEDKIIAKILREEGDCSAKRFKQCGLVAWIRYRQGDVADAWHRSRGSDVSSS